MKLFSNEPMRNYIGELMEERAKWIASGDPNLDTNDPVTELAEILHPGRTEAEITEITYETPTSRSFRLKPLHGTPIPRFNAGQYLCIYVCVEGHTVSRPYAISCSCEEAKKRGTMQFTLKKKEGGFVAEYLWNSAKIGDVIEYDAPFGEMYYNSVRDSEYIIGIAGGSGITAFRSIIEDMRQSGRPKKLTLFYGSRNENDIIFGEELDAWAKESEGRIKLIHVLSEAGDAWTGERGFITAELIRRLAPDYDKASFYVSGPTALYDFMGKVLDELGIGQTRRRMENYGESPDIESEKDFPKDQIGRTYNLTVHYGISERVVPAKSTETVVQALERSGLAIETHCRSGSCGWCRSLLEKGEVWQRKQGDCVRSSDKEAGYFHPCSAYPMSDITVRVFTQI